jgi:hypothetical protein
MPRFQVASNELEDEKDVQENRTSRNRAAGHGPHQAKAGVRIGVVGSLSRSASNEIHAMTVEFFKKNL